MFKYLLAAAITAVIMFAIYGPRSGRGSPTTFEWSGMAVAPQWVNVRNHNGGIRVEQGEIDSVEVLARVRRERRAADVRIDMSERDGHLYICPVVGSGSCGPDGFTSSERRRGLSRLFGRGNRNARVDLTIRLPEGVNADVSTANGTLTLRDIIGETKARTVNGRIDIAGIYGALDARSTNGTIRARLDSLPEGTPISIRTTNGSVTAELPADLAADVDLQTTNGRIQSLFPVQVGTELSSRRFRGKIGEGGRQLSMRTTNGSITLRPVGGVEGEDGEHSAHVNVDFEQRIEQIVEDAMRKVEVVVDSAGVRAGARGSGATRVVVSPEKISVTP